METVTAMAITAVTMETVVAIMEMETTTAVAIMEMVTAIIAITMETIMAVTIMEMEMVTMTEDKAGRLPEIPFQITEDLNPILCVQLLSVNSVRSVSMSVGTKLSTWFRIPMVSNDIVGKTLNVASRFALNAYLVQQSFG
jgi:hypothetical protein